MDVGKTFIGIDPGATGAFAMLYTDASNVIKKIALKDTARAGWTEWSTDNFDPAEMCGPDVVACIEKQQYMAKGGRRQGGKSAFLLGQEYGYWLGCLINLQCEVELLSPSPQEWQRYHFGSGTVVRDPKERSVRRVRQLFPDLELIPPKCRVPSHGRSDAVLIALYGLAWWTAKQTRS